MLACALWAGSSVAAKVALSSSSTIPPGKVGPFLLAAVRFGLAGALLFAFCRWRGYWRPIPSRDRRAFVALGTFGIAFTYGVFYGGIRFTTATETTLLVAAEPVLIALLARAVLGERMRATQISGMLVGLAGVYLIVMRGLTPTLQGTAVANAVVTGALVFEALSSVIGKRLTQSYPGLQVAALGMLIGAAVLLPFAVHETIAHHVGLPGPVEVLAIVYLTLVCSALCYGIWYLLLPRFSLSSMAAFLFIQPVLGPVYGYLLLGERMGIWTILGGGLVMLGVWLVAAYTENGQSRGRTT